MIDRLLPKSAKIMEVSLLPDVHIYQPSSYPNGYVQRNEKQTQNYFSMSFIDQSRHYFGGCVESCADDGGDNRYAQA